MESIWEKGHFSRAADLVVVGAGITGLFAALFHKRRYPHHHVLVLERGAFPAGASVSNAGFACFGSPSELLADMASEGLDATLERVQERWQGLLALRSELGDDAIGFEPSGGHEVYALDDPLYTRVASGFDELNAAMRPIFGRVPYRWDDQAMERYGLGGTGHVAYTPLEGALNSGALMRSLLRKVQGEGVLVRSHAQVVALDERALQVELSLADGTRVASAQVLLATNGYTSALIPDVDIRPARGQVLLTAPIEGLRLRGTFHAEEGFYYFRDFGGAVLLGGGRNLDMKGETTMESGTTSQIQDALERLLRETILPGIPHTIAHRWSGIMGFRANGKTPLVERRSERVCVAAGLSGMGVAIGIRVAQRAANLMDMRA